jgi:hypothetical protein
MTSPHKDQLPNYPVIVIHIVDDEGLAICCGLPWHKNPNESIGQTLWFCTGCDRELRKYKDVSKTKLG